MGITLDNASNNSAFIHLLSTWSIGKSYFFDSKFHFRCFAHVINLAVQDSLTCLEKEISMVIYYLYLIYLIFNIFIYILN